MKRLLAAILLAIIASVSFTGCQMAQDAVDGATEMVTKASEGVSDMVGDADGEDDNNGKVTDNDGIISNDDNKQNTTSD